MKNKLLLLPLFILLSYTGIRAQTLVAAQDIAIVDSNLRQEYAVVLGQLTMNIPADGEVVVRFDGTCISDSGDRIVVAASNTTNWGVNDGNVGIEVATAASGRRSFSHSRGYAVTAGSQTFYAVGQNYVDEGGSGYASISGTLTVEFFPGSGHIIVADTGYSFSGNVREVSTPMAQVVIDAPTSGTVLVHIDGQLYSTPGDVITLAASNSTYWSVDNGNVSVEASSSNIDITPYSHTALYQISAGTNTFYADVENYVDTGGTGSVIVYGNLTAEFFPDAGPVSAGLGTINQTRINLRETPAVVLDTVDINCDSAGVVLVRFDGQLYSDLGDGIFLGASDSDGLAPGTGSVSLIASRPGNLDTAGICFSSSRVYNVNPGKQTLYALVQNALITNGTGMGSVYGALTVVYYPGVVLTTAVQNVLANTNDLKIYPNPASNQITIARDLAQQINGEIELMDISGRVIKTMNAGTAPSVTLDISSLAPGIYLMQVDNMVKKFVKE